MNDTKVRMNPSRRQAKRLSVSLTERDMTDLKAVENSPEHLAELPGNLTPESSEAALVHAIFEEGMRAVKERALEEVYRRIGQEEREESQQRRARLKGRNRGGSDLL
ncbi:hypothetical protein SAMN04489752_1488 [Brevibacterium siliguriense]|uniref:Uncharacterized protein n=1 Tax=Brevibacterium siliguriense TaxID=1136497 RepID=A0A1H1RD49_9MICO|nr:hypothetical protein [Brevibacterium siliguriense]SDS33605.1 hypothetical protein SAMN04489752_1488 [Brevibacterium siliguriense]